MKGVDTVAGIGPDRGHYIPLKQRYVPLLTAMLAGVPAVTQYGYVTEICMQKGKTFMMDNAVLLSQNGMWKTLLALSHEVDQEFVFILGACEEVA